MSLTYSNDLMVWSGEYNLKNFVEKVKDRMPVLFLTKTGFYGMDAWLHEVSSTEVLWLYDIQKQGRLVGRTSDNKYLSIPMEFDLRLIHCPKTKDRWVTKFTINQALSQLNSIGPFRAKFEGDPVLWCMSNPDEEERVQFGEMDIIEYYEQKYLLCYSVISGKLNRTTVPIPVYLDITVTLATGMKNLPDEVFKQWMHDMHGITSKFMSTPVPPSAESLMLLQDKPEFSDYEYINPMKHCTISSRKNLSSKYDGNSQHRRQVMEELGRSRRPFKKGELDMVPLPRISRPPVVYGGLPRSPLTTNQEVSYIAKKNENDYDNNNTKAPLNENTETSNTAPTVKYNSDGHEGVPVVNQPFGNNFMEELLNTVKRRTNLTEESEDKRQICIKKNIHDKSGDEFSGVTPHHKPAHPLPKNTSRQVSDPAEYTCTKPGMRGTHQYTQLRNAPMTLAPPPKSAETLARRTTHTPNREQRKIEKKVNTVKPLISTTPAKQTPENVTPVSNNDHKIDVKVYKSLKDIPQFDAKTLGMEDVKHCLLLLGVSVEKCDKFHQDFVDGSILVCYTQENLVNEYGLPQTQAIRIGKFFKEGWRPLE